MGVLKEWLVRATATALREGSDILALTHIEKRALSDAKCARMAADAKDGEDELHYTEQHRERLLTLLGMSGIPLNEVKPSTNANPVPTSEVEPLADPPKRTAKGRVGERSPVNGCPLNPVRHPSPSTGQNA